MDIDMYWKIAPFGAETCQQCPLPVCVEETEARRRLGLRLLDCPLPRDEYGRVRTGRPRGSGLDRPAVLAHIAKILDDCPEGMHVQELAPRVGLTAAALDRWGRAGVLRVEKRRTRGTEGRLRLYVMGVGG